MPKEVSRNIVKENSAEKTVKSGNRLVRASEASRGGYAVASSTSGFFFVFFFGSRSGTDLPSRRRLGAKKDDPDAAPEGKASEPQRSEIVQALPPAVPSSGRRYRIHIAGRTPMSTVWQLNPTCPRESPRIFPS